MPLRISLVSIVALAVCILNLSAPSPARAQGVASEVSVAVLPFGVNVDQDLSYLKDSLPELISDRLRDAGFGVVPQDKVRQVLADNKVEFLDLASAREVALLSGANFAVYGSFNQVGESMSIDARLVEAFGLKGPVSIYVTKEGLINLLPAVDELVEKMKFDLMQKETIAEIDVEGTKVLDKDVVLMRLNIHKGDVYSARALNKDLKAIYDLGYFDDVKISVSDVPGGKKVVFIVKERPLIQAIGVQGADAIDAEDIEAAISTKKGAVLNPKILSEDLATIREMYRKEGRYNAKVEYKLEGADERQQRLTFVIDEGAKLYIQEITIEGAEQLDPDDVKSSLALSEENMFSFITKQGVLKEELLERDSAAIEAYYGNRGFINAKVAQPVVDIREDGIYITFKVVEGERYTMGDVYFEGDLVVSPEKLAEVVEADNQIAGEEYFNKELIRTDRQRLVDYYTNYGYAYAEADTRLKPQDANKTVDVTYLIAKRQRVFIRRVTVEGNTKTRENVILRELQLADGDQFSGRRLRRSIERLNRLDYFEEADIVPVPTGDPNEMDLKVKVKDKSTGAISGGAGYSSYDGMFLAARIEEKNLFGKGYTVNLSGKWSGRTNNYIFGFFNPRVNDSRLGMGLDSYLTDVKYNDFKRNTFGGLIRSVYPLGQYTNLYSSYRLDWYKIYDVKDNAPKNITRNKGINIASVLAVSASRDTTNANFLPSRGTINTLSLVNGGGVIGGDDDFVKAVYDFHYYTPLWWEHVFHFHGQVGVIGENIGGTVDDIPVYERFELGGLDTVRGYSALKISSRDDEGNYIGGNKEFFVNFEYLFPLWKEFGLTGVTFVDAGNVWKEGEGFFYDTGEDDGGALPFSLYKSIGAGIRWLSPMGPIRVEYGYGLDDVANSGHHKIEFSFGQNF